MTIIQRLKTSIKNNSFVEQLVASYKSNSKLIITHVLVWLAYLLVQNLLTIVNTKYGEFGGLLLRMFFTYSNVALLFYVNVYLILNPLLKKKLYFKTALSSILIIILFDFSRVFLYSYIFPLIGLNIFPYKSIDKEFHADSVLLAIYYLGLSYGYWYARKLTITEREKLLLEKDKNKAEKERSAAQIAFLQAQINPHFLYNTLNFLYSKALFLSEDFAESIMALSEIMRYTITYAGKDSLVSLEKEIEHIESYMHLQRYRFNNKLNVDFSIEGEDFAVNTIIPSLVLISFIENAFKHGDLNDPNTPLTIRIIVTGDTFILRIRNKKNLGVKEVSSGIGLTNIKNRLNIIYKDNYHLNVTDESLFYSLELILKTNIFDNE